MPLPLTDRLETQPGAATRFIWGLPRGLIGPSTGGHQLRTSTVVPRRNLNHVDIPEQVAGAE